MAYTLVNGDNQVSGAKPRLEFVIASADDLDALTENPPFEISTGSMAYTPDLQYIYIYEESSGWVRVGGESQVDINE